MPPRRPQSGTDKNKRKPSERPNRNAVNAPKGKPVRSTRPTEKRARPKFNVPDARGVRGPRVESETTEVESKETEVSPDSMRLQKFLAMAGVDSRRNCEDYIRTGRVTVDGEVITDPARSVNPKVQEIKLDSERLKPPRFRYFLVNKPRGFLCTNSDPQGRPRAVDLIPFTDQRLFTVGRLDENTEGMLLVTNDGDIAQRLAHPRFEVIRKYRCLVAGFPQPEILHELREGMYFAEGFFRFRSVRVFKRRGRSTILELELQEGKNREIRRLMARVGHKVQALERIAFGPLKLGSLPPGRHRELSSFEIRQLRQFIEKGESSELGPRRTGGSGQFGYRSGQTRGDRKRTQPETIAEAPTAGRSVVTERSARPERPERPTRASRPERQDRPGSAARPVRQDRPESAARPVRQERPDRTNASGRPVSAVRSNTVRPTTTRASTSRPATTRPATTRPATTRPATTRPATTRPQPARPQEKLSTIAGVAKPKPIRAKQSKRKPSQGAAADRPVRPINKGRDRRRQR